MKRKQDIAENKKHKQNTENSLNSISESLKSSLALFITNANQNRRSNDRQT